MDTFPIHVIGASGRSGAALAEALGGRIVPVVRDAAKWAALGFAPRPRIADLSEDDRLREALRDATHIVSCAHARHAARVIAAAPPEARLVFLGSTRKFTRWPDDHGKGVMAGEAAFLASGHHGVMLHPTMIYGAAGEDNVQRIAVLVRRLPVLPLPRGRGSLVQPIHQSDVTKAILAALTHDWSGPETIVIAGPAPVPYGDFLAAIAAAAGVRSPLIVSVPAAVLIAAAAVSWLIPNVPTIWPSEVRRLLEDKAFDISAMRSVLGVTPIPLEQGLALTFRPMHGSRSAA